MAKPVRLKAKAEAVPQTREAADQLLGEIGALRREIARIELSQTDDIARIKKAAADASKPLADAAKAKFIAFAAWAGANRDSLLIDGRKSVALSQGTFGWRWGKSGVQVDKEAEEEVIAALELAGRDDLLRVKTELDLVAILRDPTAIEELDGIAIVQVETFWAAPLDVKTEETKLGPKRVGAAVDAAEAA